MPAGSKPLGEVLVEERLISREQLSDAMRRQQETGRPIGKILLEMGALTEDALVEAVASQLGVPYIDLVAYPPSQSVALLVSKEVAARHQAVPVELDERGLLVAMVEPTNQAGLREISEITGYACRPALAPRRRILEVIDLAYSGSAALDPMEDVLQEVVGPAPRHLEPDAKEISMHELLDRMVEEDASDLHLTQGSPPTIRVHGHLRGLDDFPVMQPAELRKLLYSILTQRQRESLEESLELDLAYSYASKARFRINVYFQKDSIGAAIRLIPTTIRSIGELGVPPKVADFAYLARGLVLVTGPTGSGKSTTLAGIIDIVNSERADHILTVEDPIEYLHRSKTAIVNQREVGADTRGFANALRSALRQDPDVILVGEMRDLETIQTALTAAETGHLVFATLHTQSAPEAVDRIVDVFPPHQQQQVRTQLGATIQGIVTQQLLQNAEGNGRVIACEVLVATPAVRNLIREGKTHMIYSSMQAGGSYGMQTMDQALGQLVREGKITFELGLERCHSAEEFTRLAGRG
ncbi:MAG: PilT/PilU family type 4a pilus ATPase [Actinomycetota bacterium]